MTKQDILQMNNSLDISKALAENRDLWCQETSDHLRDVKRKEDIAQYGTEFIFIDPFRKK